MRNLDQQISSLRARQASAWVSALAKPDSEVRETFIAWLKESPVNVREFLLAHALEQSLSQLDAQRSIDVDALLAQLNPQVTTLPVVAAERAQTTRPQRRWPYKLAAGIAAMGVIGLGMWTQRQANWQEFTTGIGEQRALQLEDGSVVHLNAHSRIAMHFSANARDVKLIEGEALFDVHHDAQRPFRVFTHDAVIRDVGTRFNVHSRADGVQVAVLEGSVELTAAASAGAAQRAVGKQPPHIRVVTATQQAQIDHSGKITIETPPDVADAAAWWQRRLVYRKETLAHIVEDLNRYNRRQIRLEGEAVRGRAYTGVFNADDPESLAQVLASDPELMVERLADNTIVIREP
jgi:transmembrane sensor